MIDGVSAETWNERVRRIFPTLPPPATSCPLPPEAERALLLDTAQFQADKEMLNEIHLMLRILVERSGD